VRVCQNLEKSCTEICDVRKMAFGDNSMSRTQVLERVACCKEGRTSVESDANFEAKQKCCSQFSSVKTVLCIMTSLQRVKQ
jgi:hypothetical protein